MCVLVLPHTARKVRFVEEEELGEAHILKTTLLRSFRGPEPSCPGLAGTEPPFFQTWFVYFQSRCFITTGVSIPPHQRQTNHLSVPGER